MRNMDLDWFFLALYSIRLTHALIILFHLLSPAERKRTVSKIKSFKCKRSAFKNLIRLSSYL